MKTFLGKRISDTEINSDSDLNSDSNSISNSISDTISASNSNSDSKSNLDSGKKNKLSIIIPSLFMIAAVIIELIAWIFPGFSDWYIEHIFPIWINTYGRFTSIFPFSVGEILLIIGIVLIIVSVVVLLVYIATKVRNKICKKVNFHIKFFGNYFRFLYWTISIVSLVMVLNCFVLYHATTFSVKYQISEEKHTLEEITILRNYVVAELNRLATTADRDENQELIYKGDMLQEAKNSMRDLGKTYPALSGFYVTPKWIINSDFLSQQSIMGYYFPFSMEANLNKKMYIINKPATLCHELAHTKGFIYENEANFIGYLACINSDNDFFRYSGYMSVLNYLDRDFYKALGENIELYKQYPLVSEQVKADDIFLTKKAWEDVEKKAVLSTETVENATDHFLTSNLTMNGVEEGIASYGEVVDLLLDYYKGILY